MAYTGQTISNPATGERFTFLQTTEDTGGERLLFDCRVRPDGKPLPPHIHTTQEEHLEVVDGTLGVMLDDQIYVLQEGQDIVLPVRVKHQWWNAGRDELYMRVEVVPARQLEVVIEAVSAMARDGEVRANGMPRNPFKLVNVLRLAETYTPGVPIWMQLIALIAVASVGRLLGYDAAFTQYRAIEPEREQVSPDRSDAA